MVFLWIQVRVEEITVVVTHLHLLFRSAQVQLAVAMMVVVEADSSLLLHPTLEDDQQGSRLIVGVLKIVPIAQIATIVDAVVVSSCDSNKLLTK